MSSLRGGLVLTTFFTLTLPLMPLQALFVRVSPKAARTFPHWYHRKVCRILGVDLDIEGEVVRDAPVLLVSNHTSWLDIPVLSAVAPVSFVAKREVGGWPFVASLARLQRTVFVDRARRQDAGAAANAMAERLEAGDTIVLFPEGTSSDGNRVLPFKSSLFGAVDVGGKAQGPAAVVQTVAVVYTHQHGVPLSRADRPRVGWYGDMEMLGHAWQVLKGGPIAATIRIGQPIPLQNFADRKALARSSEREIRRAVHSVLRGRGANDAIEPVEPNDDQRRLQRPGAGQASGKWI